MSKCVECTFLELDHKYNSYTNEYWCDNGYVQEWKKPESRACDSFCEAYSRSTKEMNDAIKGISDGCFIVTMACNLLGREPKNDKCLQTFKAFKRDLIKQGKHNDFLVLYESLGPVIAHKIRSQRENSTRIAKNLYFVYFPEIMKDIDEGKNEKALKKYVDLVKVLANGCGYSIEKSEDKTVKVYTKKY